MHKLPKFDGIYFDTYGENQVPFHEYVHNILNFKGIYSFFNNPNTAQEEFNYPYLALQEIIKSPIAKRLCFQGKMIRIFWLEVLVSIRSPI